jgi:hypothetical protein
VAASFTAVVNFTTRIGRARSGLKGQGGSKGAAVAFIGRERERKRSSTSITIDGANYWESLWGRERRRKQSTDDVLYSGKRSMGRRGGRAGARSPRHLKWRWRRG